MSSRNTGHATANRKLSDGANLYVKNFGPDLTETKLCQLFATYGIITSCKIQTDSNGQSRGFGFVNFERPEMAQHAMEKLNGYALDNDKHLYVGPFQRKSERHKELRRIQEDNNNQRSKNLCLYISNLDVMIDEKLLEEVFSRFGRVTKTHILRTGSQSKGVGSVCFDSIEATGRALTEMNGKWIYSKPIYVKLSEGMNHSPSITPTPPMPSNPSLNPMPPLMVQMPYLNYPAMFYLPTIMVPPSRYNFPFPTLPINSPVPSPTQYTSSPHPPLQPLVRASPSTTTQVKRSSYPYTPVKIDDEQNDC